MDYLADTANVSIPVMIDDVKRDLESFEMTRTRFLLIESTEPEVGLTAAASEVRLPAFLLSLSGVVYRPSESSDTFNSAKQIEELHETVEASELLEMESDELWLPTSPIDEVRSEPKFGDVFRVALPLFRLSMSFGRDGVTLASFLEQANSMRQQVTYSDVETSAFRDWYQQQVEEAEVNYEKQLGRDSVLDWKGD